MANINYGLSVGYSPNCGKDISMYFVSAWQMTWCQTIYPRLWTELLCFWCHLLLLLFGIIRHTCVHHYNPSVRIIDLVSHTSYIVCVNFIIYNLIGGTYSLKSTPNDRFFEKLFIANLFTLTIFAKYLLSSNHRRNIFCILILMSGLGHEPWLYVLEANILLNRLQRLHNTTYFT